MVRTSHYAALLYCNTLTSYAWHLICTGDADLNHVDVCLTHLSVTIKFWLKGLGWGFLSTTHK